ncbi:MAG: hypothetical protein AAF634_17345 [Bacteroidota bacterium]
MKKHILLALLIIGGVSHSFGQLNSYKYIVIPKRLDAFKSENQFRTSTLLKYLFTNEGFNAVYEGSFPEDLKKDPCLGLNTDLVDASSLFSIKASILLRDCNGVVVFETPQGKKKTKEYEQAYKEVISEAFGALRGLNYTYDPKEKEEKEAPITVSFQDDVKSLEEEPKGETVMVSQKEKAETLTKEQLATSPSVMDNNKDVLYAQPIEDGFQLVDTTPKVVYIIKSTSAPEVFLVNQAGKNGVVFKEGGKWYIEFDEKGGKAKELNIKF